MNIRDALAGGGLLLAAAAFVAGGIVGEQAQPIKQIDEAAESIGIAPVHSYCHAGWEADEVKTQGIVSLTCQKDNVTVILDGTGAFNIAEHNGRFIEREAEVPGW